MKYVDNSFYPAWIPEEVRHIVDLSELAEPNIIFTGYPSYYFQLNPISQKREFIKQLRWI